MFEPSFSDMRHASPADLVPENVTPELLLCTALVRSGLVDGAGASLVLTSQDRIGLAATDDVFTQIAEIHFSTWEGPGPEVVQSGKHVAVDDLHAQGARWPLTTPHAAATPMRALATFPLSNTHGLFGLFAAYRATPGPFSSADLSRLQAAAATMEVLVHARLDSDDLTLLAPASTLSIAVGMIVARLDLDADHALALLRARAFTAAVSASALAREVIDGVVDVEDLRDAPDP